MFSKKNLEADLYYLMRKYTSACLSTFFFFHPVLYWQLHEIIYACKGGLYGCTFSLTHLSCGVFLCSELDAQMDGCLQQRLFTSGIPLRVFCTLYPDCNDAALILSDQKTRLASSHAETDQQPMARYFPLCPAWHRDCRFDPDHPLFFLVIQNFLVPLPMDVCLHRLFYRSLCPFFQPLRFSSCQEALYYKMAYYFP